MAWFLPGRRQRHPPHSVRTNCVGFALALYWRRRRAGREGYIVLRRSRWGPFPHMLYAEARRDGRLRLVRYRPTSPRARACPPLVFKGSSRWGDL